MNERRRCERREIWQPVSLNTAERPDRVGMIRDMSATGLLFHSRSRYTIGEQLTMMYRRHDRGAAYATGQVVRAVLDPNQDTMFPYLTAVRFDSDVELPRV
jgi:hypothetical protein